MNKTFTVKELKNTHLSTNVFPTSLEKKFAEIIAATGEDLSREGLRDTPQRAAKAWSFLTQGYCQNLKEVINNAVFDVQSNEMVVLKNIEFYSMCEHHLLPFVGKCHIAYIPQGKVLGISKLARIVNHFSRRLQIQEVLTAQIAQTIMKAVNAKGVAVNMEAQHFCMMMRGIEKQNSIMTTSARLGVFQEDHLLKSEFLSVISK